MWFGKSEKEMELAHQERMKCLEMGFPLPDADLAWVEAVQLRGGQVTAVVIVGIIALACAPVGATAILLALVKDAPPWLIPTLLFSMWGVSGWLMYTLIKSGLNSLSQIRRPADFAARPAPTNGTKLAPKQESGELRFPSEAIQEGRFQRPATPQNG